MSTFFPSAYVHACTRIAKLSCCEAACEKTTWHNSFLFLLFAVLLAQGTQPVVVGSAALPLQPFVAAQQTQAQLQTVSMVPGMPAAVQSAGVSTAAQSHTVATQPVATQPQLTQQVRDPAEVVRKMVMFTQHVSKCLRVRACMHFVVPMFAMLS